MCLLNLLVPNNFLIISSIGTNPLSMHLGDNLNKEDKDQSGIPCPERCHISVYNLSNNKDKYGEVKCETTLKPYWIRGNAKSETCDQYQKYVGVVDKIEPKENIEFFNLTTFNKLKFIVDPLPTQLITIM